MGETCLKCNKRISITNLRHFKCKTCRKFCHQNCVKGIHATCIKQTYIKTSGSHRYKVIRNEKWQCDKCILQELPCTNLSNLQISQLATPHIKSLLLPSPEKLNELFAHEKDYHDNKNEFEFTHFYNNTEYTTTQDVEKLLNFNDESKSHQNFPIISLNVRSIVNKKNFTKFQAFLSSLPIKPMIIALNETWITDSSNGPYKKLRGYHKFVQSNRKHCVGGGVGFYITDHLHFNKIEELSIMEEKTFESLFLEVDIGEKKIVCGSIYRSPESAKCFHDGFSEKLSFVLKESLKLKKPTILLGDLNYNLLNTKDKHVSSCVDTFFEFGFYPLINIPTRITENTGSVLDHIWTNIMDVPVKTAVIADPVSDHLPVIMNLCIEMSKEKEIVEKRRFSEKAIEKFNNFLQEMDISDILSQKSTNGAYDLFLSKYLKIFNKCFPLKKMTKYTAAKQNCPWYTNELRELNEMKQKKYMLHIKNKNNIFLKSDYNTTRNNYFQNVKKTKREYYQKHLKEVKNDIKGTWYVINSVLGRQNTRDLFKLSINGVEEKNKCKIATEFNTYFSNVAEKLVKEIPVCKWRKRFNEYLGKRNPKSMFFRLQTQLKF